MSYLVLARKWRPQTFDEIIGQQHVAVTLKNAIQSGRVAHAYLFAGPRGTGKTTTARVLAKALNCYTGPTPTPCNNCTLCNEITNANCVDVLEIDGASNRGIDEIRNLRENVKYAPSSGKHKIYIIDEVHMLTEPAFNALLKTLEEPPSHVIFIFATTEPYKIPETILSRCQRFDFKLIPVNQIVDRLTLICRKEKINIDNQALFLIAKKAEGSLRDAESLLDQILVSGSKKISFDEVHNLLGIVPQDKYFELTDIIANKDTKSGLLLLYETLESGYDLNEYVSGLLEHLRNMLIVKIDSKNNRLINLPEVHITRYMEQMVRFTTGDLFRLIKIVSELEASIKRASQPRILLEVAIVRMIELESTVILEELLTRLNQLERKLITAYDKQTDKVPQPEDKSNELRNSTSYDVTTYNSSNNKLTIEKVKTGWESFVEQVIKRKVSLGSFLKESVPERLEDNKLTITFPKCYEFHKQQVEDIKNLQLIQSELKAFFGFPLNMICKIKDENTATTSTDVNPNIRKKLTTEQLISQQPIIGKLIELFDGEILL